MEWTRLCISAKIAILLENRHQTRISNELNKFCKHFQVVVEVMILTGTLSPQKTEESVLKVVKRRVWSSL